MAILVKALDFLGVSKASIQGFFGLIGILLVLVVVHRIWFRLRLKHFRP